MDICSGIVPNISNFTLRQSQFVTQPRSLFTLPSTSGVSCWLWKINSYFKWTDHPPQMSAYMWLYPPSKWNSTSKGTGGKQRRVPLLPFRLGGGRVQQHKCLHWDANLNLKHISHAWITKHFNWTKFHNPKIKVFHIQRLIHQLFGQVDRKRTQFMVPRFMVPSRL